MERMFSKSDKQRKAETIDRNLKRLNQTGIANFLEIDPHLAKCEYFEKQREEINKIKKRDVGINNTRAIYAREEMRKEKRQQKKEKGMFGLLS